MIEEIEKENFFCLRLKEDISKIDFCKKVGLLSCFVITDCDDLKIGDRILIVKNNSKIHVVKPSETLKSIAIKYGVEEKDICHKNNIKQIFVGQHLVI